jgi:hypothetical protein
VDLIQDGVLEYDDWFDAYVWNHVALREPLWRRVGRKLGLWYVHYKTKEVPVMDIMSYCPYCGEKINYGE